MFKFATIKYSYIHQRYLNTEAWLRQPWALDQDGVNGFLNRINNKT